MGNYYERAFNFMCLKITTEEMGLKQNFSNNLFNL